jgi:4-hydroxy-tetrahydrodipicolinate reductase
MGQAVSKLAAGRDDMTIAAGVDKNTVKLSDFPVYADPMEYSGKADVLIDFSHPAALPDLLSYCTRRGIPLLMASTGHAEDADDAIAEAAKTIPVFRSANMSLGISLLLDLCAKAAMVLNGYDIEILERHHNQKLDAPSGTAKIIYDRIAAAVPYQAEQVCDRSEVRRKREKKEIGMSCIRGGTIVGEHEVIFAGHDEIIEIRHSAASRDVFAAGALNAAKYLSVRKPGLYGMRDLIAGY